LLRRVVWWLDTDVSEDRVVSIFTVNKNPVLPKNVLFLLFIKPKKIPTFIYERNVNLH